ncbi:DUF3309 family protein [Nannocystis sp. ILAH1]|uniref:DUF3309 family protein n=1 Tax=unclassified Nannocystis TaxID=2627009 RepID=UPI002270BA1B|nr:MULTISPECIES: DUF3309 family protein [unclassified Nannocystis]MCY0993911.1 DUF3309 family protein [Nannocystis sp. ILAH1]MCY1066878.1 DUF3309 family protein [Nannocystis sp. RBIL2]
MFGFWLVIILAILLLSTLPKYQHTRHWGYYPSGIIGLMLLVVICLMWFDLIAFSWPWVVPVTLP